MKTIFQITSPLNPSEVRLWGGLAKAQEQVGSYSVFPLGKAGMGQNNGLVKTPLTQSDGMERNRQHIIGLGQIDLEGGLICQDCHAGRAGQASAEFQCKDERRDRRLVEKQGAGKIEGILLLETITAEVIVTAGKREATKRATGRTDIGNCGQATGTKERRPGPLQPPLASQTDRGEEQILQCLEIRGHHLPAPCRYILVIMALPKAEQDNSSAPSIRRARS